MAVSKAKAKEILGHGEVKGHALTAKQKGFFGARAGGQKMNGGLMTGKYDKKGRANKHPNIRKNPGAMGGGLPLKNAPIFKGPSDPSEGGGVPDKLKEPLDPPGFSLPGAGGLTNLKGLHQNQQGQDPMVKDLPFPAAIQDSDFHPGGLSPGTKDAWK